MNNIGYTSILFSELANAFLSEKKIRCRETTSDGYEILLKTHILPFFGEYRIDEIKPITVRNWQNLLLSKSLKDRYTRRIDTLLVSIFNYGVRFFELPNNPAILAGPIGVKPEKIVNFWTIQEFNIFINIIDKPILHLLFNALYWTGMRIGELLALSPEDICFEGGYLSINKTYHKSRGKDYISPPKTSKGKRDIYLHTKLLEEFKDYIEKISKASDSPPMKQKYDTTTSRSKSNVTFTRLFPFTTEYVRYHLARYTRKAKLKEIRVHDLRHSHASLLIELNVSPLLISERLGHEKVDTTLSIYSHLYPNKQKQLTSLLDKTYETHDNFKYLPII